MSPEIDRQHMTRALELAARGQGHVEPNPMVGCVIARGTQVIAEGWHHRYGEAHAETEALRRAPSETHDATIYVTLEPCCHHGKTPPCTEAVVRARPARVVIAMQDPFPKVNGGGVRQLTAAGIDVSLGLLEAEARALNAPYLMRVVQRRPWLLAKWAMTLDGKLATPTGNSRWISSPASRHMVHRLRGRMDAILIGRGTVLADDPALTARPSGPRVASRVVLASRAEIPVNSQLVRTAAEVPVLIAASPAAPRGNIRSLQQAGCDVLTCQGETAKERLEQLLEELAGRGMTNVLVEGGGQVLGSFHDADLIDEVHVFIAPKLAGGAAALTPVAGKGVNLISAARELLRCQVQSIDGDIYVQGRLRSPSTSADPTT